MTFPSAAALCSAISSKTWKEFLPIIESLQKTALHAKVVRYKQRQRAQSHKSCFLGNQIKKEKKRRKKKERNPLTTYNDIAFVQK